jgi:hypothetical protein
LTPPAPATNFRTMINNGQVDLFWTASPGPDLKGYYLAYKQGIGSFSTAQFIDNVLTYHLNGLTNGVNYTFRIWAENTSDLLSTPVDISTTIGYMVFLNGTPNEALTNALSLAQSGDTITLGASTFILSAHLSLKGGVNLIGAGPHLTMLDGTGLDSVIQLSGLATITKGIVSNFTIYGTTTGIDAHDYNLTVRNIVITNCQTGILGNADSQMDIINNTILGNTTAGIYVAGPTIVRNNIILGNAQGINWAGGAGALSDLVISYNDVHGNGTNYVNCTAGNNDISNNVLFINESAYDYREQAEQPTIDMGDPANDWSNEPDPHGGRINMGAFGNTPYATTSGLLHIATTMLSDGESATAYWAQISTGGGSPPVTWTLISGHLPPSVILEYNTGIITGTVSPDGTGTYHFTIEINDTISSIDTADFTLIIRASGISWLRIVPDMLSDGETGTAYSVRITVADGVPPYTWSLVKGNLPINVELNPNTGKISGTPLYGTAGEYPITIQVIDATDTKVRKDFIIKINSPTDSGSSGTGSDKNCFIATAAFGSPLAPAVRILRQFRDKYLVPNNVGAWFVNQYYRHSPKIAAYIAGHNWARTLTRIALIPAIGYSWFMVSTDLTTKILFSILGLLALLGFIYTKRIKHLRVTK